MYYSNLHHICFGGAILGLLIATLLNFHHILLNSTVVYRMGKKDKKTETSDGSSDEEFVVEKVLDKRTVKGKVIY